MSPTPITADYVVVGTGLTGATIARLLADEGREVVMLERRGHVGGNVHDARHACGIAYHTHGPHYFRTSSDEIWRFVNRFSSFYRYQAVVQSRVEGRYEAWPVSRELIERRHGRDWRPPFVGVAANFEEGCLGKMPRDVYELYVRGYTEKQWGVPAHTLSAELATRVRVAESGDRRLLPHRYQGLPTAGYAAMMARMIAGIPVVLDCDYFAIRSQVRARKLLIYTGPIDTFFDYAAGRLLYRGQRRRHQFVPGATRVLPCAQVNLPEQGEPAVRMIEWSWLVPPGAPAACAGTLLTTETPYTPDDPDDYEYPFPDTVNQGRYLEYRRRADALAGVLICGRLGEYRYLDMDQAIARARLFARRACGITRFSARSPLRTTDARA